MSTSLFARHIGARFRPVSAKLFSTYAKNLSRLTGDGLARSRETLARIYRYSGTFELQKVLEQPGTPGPFDDDIPTDEFNNKELREAIEGRNARAMHLIVEANKERYNNGAPRPTMLQLHSLQLFSRPKVHLAVFRELAIPKKTSAERRQERQKYSTRPVDKPSSKRRGQAAKSVVEKNPVAPESSKNVRSLTSETNAVVVVTRKRRRECVKPYDVLDY